MPLLPSLPSAQQDTVSAKSVAVPRPQTGPRDSSARKAVGGRNLAPSSVPGPLDAPNKRNRLRQLQLFCYTALTSSLTKAAERALVTQSSASQQVRALERELQVELFERRGPRIALTAAGRQLYELTMPLVEGLDNLYATFHERFNHSLSGEVRIAAEPSAAGFLLPRYLKRFHQQHPGVRLNVKNAFHQEALNLLREHAVDFVVGSMGMVPGDLRHRLVLTSEIVLAVHEGHPLARRESVSPREFEKYPMLLPPAGHYTRHLWNIYAMRHDIQLDNVLLEVGGWWIIKNFVQSGLGISPLPKLCVGEGERISLIPFAERFPELAYGVTTYRRASLGVAARQLVQMMAPGDRPVAA